MPPRSTARTKTQPKPTPPKVNPQAWMKRNAQRNATTVEQAKINTMRSRTTNRVEAPTPKGPAVRAREVGPQIAQWARNQAAKWVAPPYKGGTPSLGTTLANTIRTAGPRGATPAGMPNWMTAQYMPQAQARTQRTVSQALAEVNRQGSAGRKALLPESAEGYTEPVPPGYPMTGAGAGGGGGYGGYGSNYSSYPETGYPGYGSNVYAQGGRGYNPSAQVPRWWHSRLTWRF